MSTICPLVLLRLDITPGCVSSNALSLKNSSLSLAVFKSAGSPILSDREIGLKVCLTSILGPFNLCKGPSSKPLSVLAAVETLLISGPNNAFPLEGAKSCKACV